MLWVSISNLCSGCRKYGARCPSYNSFGHAADQHVPERAVPVSPHHDQVDRFVFRLANDFKKGWPGPYVLGDLQLLIPQNARKFFNLSASFFVPLELVPLIGNRLFHNMEFVQRCFESITNLARVP